MRVASTRLRASAELYRKELEYMSINRKELAEIAALAKLKIADDAMDEIATAMNDIKEMIDDMDEVTAQNVKPMSHPMDAMQRLRADVVTETSHQSALLDLSQQADETHYLVPKVIE